MARSLATGLFRYGESELDPAVHAEILLESARSEARVAILIVLLALGFCLWYKFQGEVVAAISIFAVLTVLPLLIDAQLRRSAAKRARGRGPQPMPRRPASGPR
jgi:hypothetical protein